MKNIINQKGSVLLYGILAVIIMGAGIIYTMSLNKKSIQSGANEQAMTEEKDTMKEEPVMDDGSDKMMEEKDATMKDTSTMMQEDIEAMLEKDKTMLEATNTMMENNESAKAGVYTTFTTASYANSSDTKRVLFFHATWCPFCKEADADFQANLNKIPAGVTLLKTDYDSEKELKKKYGVTYQHTFVQVDANGDEVTKWNGGGADELIARVK